MFAAAASDYTALWFFLVVAVVIGLIFYQARKRAQDLERVAQELGLRFEAKEAKEALPDPGFGALPLFQHSRARSNILSGRRGTGDIFLADVRVGSGKNSYMQTVACFHLRGRGLPKFELMPESWGHKLAQAFGYKDIDFESSPEFSRSYQLRGEDETGVRGLFGADLLHFFTGEKGWTVEGAGDWLCVFFTGEEGSTVEGAGDRYRFASTVSPKDIRAFLDETEAVAQQFARSRW